MSARFIVGDTRDVLATLPDASVDLVLTSPPFLALRSYLPADHPDKHREIGSEPDPAAFIDTLLALTAGWRRVLTPHGSICIELGDTYSGAGGYGSPDSPNPAYGDGERFEERWEGRTTKRFKRADDGWPMAKCLALIPELYRVALAYGRNPLTGVESLAGTWRVRNVVRWVRPNPPVGALGDKFRPATSDMVVACVAKDRWFDLDAVRTKNDRAPHTDNRGGHRRENIPGRTGQMMNPVDDDGHRIQENEAGAPPLDWWKIAPSGYKGSHYATWPPELCVKPIQAMCPREVCRQCGEPRRRMLGETTYMRTDSDRVPARLTMLDGERPSAGVNQHTRPDGANTSVTANTETIGWTDCGHGDYRPGMVLDPFAGTFTTGMVAHGLGRDSIGIDLDERNLDLARQRLGMFLTEGAA